MGRLFRAEFRRSVDGYPDYVLHCRQCDTRERCYGDKPHDVAKIHARFWHPGPRIPIGWANPGAGPLRVCEHRQCPSYECRGC